MYIYIFFYAYSHFIYLYFYFVFLFKGIRHYSVYVCMCFHNFYDLILFICLFFKSTVLFLNHFSFCCWNQKSAKYRHFCFKLLSRFKFYLIFSISWKNFAHLFAYWHWKKLLRLFFQRAVFEMCLFSKLFEVKNFLLLQFIIFGLYKLGSIFCLCNYFFAQFVGFCYVQVVFVSFVKKFGLLNWKLALQCSQPI